jgi:hypothetical protein
VLRFLLLFTALLFLAEFVLKFAVSFLECAVSFLECAVSSVHGVDFSEEKQNADSGEASREASPEELHDERHRGVFVPLVSLVLVRVVALSLQRVCAWFARCCLRCLTFVAI